MTSEILTQEHLKEILHYNHYSGIFTWLSDKGNYVKTGSAAGYLSLGYVRITISGIAYMGHRLAWLYLYGHFPKEQIDHINGIKSDNRVANLRCVSHRENMKNKAIMKNNSSGITGVYLRNDTNKWTAEITTSIKKIKLGSFADKFEAICARKSAEFKHAYHENHGRRAL